MKSEAILCLVLPCHEKVYKIKSLLCHLIDLAKINLRGQNRQQNLCPPPHIPPLKIIEFRASRKVLRFRWLKKRAILQFFKFLVVISLFTFSLLRLWGCYKLKQKKNNIKMKTHNIHTHFNLLRYFKRKMMGKKWALCLTFEKNYTDLAKI